jgi:ABC-type antimicrobial peptide transport system ATPase subunit
VGRQLKYLDHQEQERLKIFSRELSAISRRDTLQMKSVTYHLPTKQLMNVSQESGKGLKVMTKMILDILEPYILGRDNSLLRFPF